MNVRSVGMNNHMGGPVFDPTGVGFRTESSITRPSDFFVFIDEDELTINDSLFRVDRTADIQDKASGRHSRRCNLSFADGHVEGRAWTGSATDRTWLREHATELQ